MEGDPRNPSKSLLKKYDIPIDHLSYEYVENCTDKKELERIVRILRSGEEGFYPDLLKVTENRLRKFAPDSRVLRLETPVLTKDSIPSDEWNEVEKELLAWEEEMMIIDKSLDFEKGRIELVGSKNMPGVRETIKPEPKKTTCKSDLNKAKNSIRIKSGDYASWDKFDVDKELIKIDVEEERKEEENKKKKLEIKKLEAEKKLDINIDKDSYSSVEKQVLANQAKERGNECFKAGDFKNALTYYNISINLFDSLNAYNNRAMTYLKLNEYNEAVKDCNVVLQKEKTNTKALYRRATAYQNMANDSNNYDLLALQDLKEVVLLEPNNKMAQLGLQKLKAKLGIQTTGKKFRMSICESDQSSDKENRTSSYNKEKNLYDCSRGILHNIDNLPLTYYGPSTSSFECQPHSMTHRALSGSLLASEILCKCNSSRPMQNPLCQKCGEAMCAPKLLSNAKKANFVPKPTAKTQNVTENVVQKLGFDEVNNLKETCLENTSPEKFKSSSSQEMTSNCDEVLVSSVLSDKETSAMIDSNIKMEASKVKDSENNLSVSVSKPKNELQQEASAIDNINRSVIEKLDVDKSNVKRSEPKNVESLDARVLKESSKTKENILSDEKSKEKVSSEVAKVAESKDKEPCSPLETKKNLSSGKSTKVKKKKSKNHRKKDLSIQDEWEKVTPLRVVHADKYLHPTSVEPKIKADSKKKDEPEVNLTGVNNFKAFVPNRQCLSVRAVESNLAGNRSNPSFGKSVQESAVGERVRLVSSDTATAFEGNKENVLKNPDRNVGGNGEKFGRKSDGKEKPETEDEFSPFKFATRWDMLQKHDDAYSKRAEMIRSIGPSKLGEAIGVKLDCGMLVTLLECLEKQFVETEPNVVVDILKQLPQMPRFGLINMFLAEKDKKVMKNLIEVVESKGFALKEIKKNLLPTS